MALNLSNLFTQTDVRETVTNETPSSVLFDLDYARLNQSTTCGEVMEGIHFSPSGLKNYTSYITSGTGTASTIEEFDLSERWNVDTMVTNQTLDVDAKDNDIRGVIFKPDGLEMYFVGAENDMIYQYTLSTAWDISSATYTREKAAGTDPASIYFREDGKQVFVGFSVGNNIITSILTTPWDISTMSTVSTDDVGTVARGISFNKAGTKLFVTLNTGAVNMFELTKPFTISSQGTVNTDFTIFPDGNITEIYFRPNGSILYCTTSDLKTIQQYSIRRGWR